MKRKIRRHQPATVQGVALRAGAMRIDITPVLGIPNGGYGIWGATQNGVWQRLFASVLVLEASRQRVAFVGADVHVGTRYLHEAVAARTHAVGVTTDCLMLGATHTHYGPSGIYADGFYDLNAGAEKGFLEDVTNWIAGRIAHAIEIACQELRPAKVGVGEVKVWGYSRNRSLGAFVANGVTPAQFAASHGLAAAEAAKLTPEEMAVDPRVRVMMAFGADGGPIGGFGTVNVHNTTLLPMRDSLSSDWIGWAIRGAQRALRGRGGVWAREPLLPLAIVSGSAGDVNGVREADDRDTMTAEEREEAVYQARATRLMTQRVGDRYARAISDACVAASQVATSNVAVSTRWVEAEATATGELAPEPKVGAPTLGGAEGLRMTYRRENTLAAALVPTQALRALSEWLAARCPEPSKHDDPTRPHHPKKLFPEDVLGQHDDIPDIGSVILSGLQGRANSLFPIRVFTVGTHSWIGLPGEPTTYTGHQLERAAIAKLGGTSAIVGYCGDYIGYFATKKEYDEQHYEGSSTLWGPKTVDWLEARIGNLCDRAPDGPPSAGFVEFDKLRRYDLIDPPQASGIWSAPQRTLQGDEHVVWWMTPKKRIWLGEAPAVVLEHRVGGEWLPFVHDGVPVSDREYAFELRRSGAADGKFVWSVSFTPDRDLEIATAGRELRFRLAHPAFAHLSATSSFTGL